MKQLNSLGAINRNLKKNIRFSLANEYFLFIMIVLMSVCLLSAFFYYYAHNAYINNRNENLQHLAKEISQEINGIFEENEDILKFFGKKISSRSKTENLSDIVNLLLYTGNLNIKRMAHAYLVWANANGRIVVSGKEGIVTYPLDIKKRKYYETAREKPWTLQIAHPDRSYFSRNHILPLAMGIEDKGKGFLGYLLIGLRIEYINKFLDKIAESNKTSFIVLNENFDILFKSSDNAENLARLIDKDKIRQFIMSKKNLVSQPFELEEINYYHHAEIPNSSSSYVILTGINKNLERVEFLDQVIPRLCEFLFMGFFCSVLLYFFRKKIINPITKLSQTALAISKGFIDTAIPRQNSIEMTTLAKSLLLVIRHIKRNEYYKRKLERASKIIRTSDEARESFVKRLHLELSFSLKEIAVYSSVLYKHFMEKSESIMNKKQITACLEKIQEAVMQIRSKTSNSLELTYFNLNMAVEQSIQINLKSALLKKINIKFDFQDNIPLIYADELRLKQILVSLLCQSIENSPEESEINLATRTALEEHNLWFQIVIKDQGFGLDQTELNKIQEKFGWTSDVETFELTSMEIKYIEKLVIMHGGKLYIQNEIHEGRTISLYLPLQNQKDNVVYLKSSPS